MGLLLTFSEVVSQNRWPLRSTGFYNRFQVFHESNQRVDDNCKLPTTVNTAYTERNLDQFRGCRLQVPSS